MAFNRKKHFIESQKEKLVSLSKEVHKLVPNTPSKTHIIPILIGSNESALNLSEKLKSCGYYIPAIRPPTVPEGTSRLRLSLTADSKLNDIKNVLKLIHES